jgi:hypothetical protein
MKKNQIRLTPRTNKMIAVLVVPHNRDCELTICAYPCLAKFSLDWQSQLESLDAQEEKGKKVDSSVRNTFIAIGALLSEALVLHFLHASGEKKMPA